ncbi:fungal-specific transcription factor [Xylariaceae sp. FL0255]|nr:fungal-specific transcription factor [Xylariaceae sp. FL0255]
MPAAGDLPGNDSASPGTDNSPDAEASVYVGPRNNNDVPKPKRLACMICRKRKLRCDGNKPSCSTCTRLGHTCAYDEVRKKSGPKRGYVKALEERLKQVEELLKTQEPNTSTSPETAKAPAFEQIRNQPTVPTNFNVANPPIPMASDRDMDSNRWRLNGESPQGQGNNNNNLEDFGFTSNLAMNMGNMDPSFTWEMIGLGLEEPLPPQETIDELHQLYFEKIHPSIPMVHRFRYLAAMNLAPNQRPPVALRYAMWTLACSITEKYNDLKFLFYQRARKYMEADSIRGYGEHLITIAHCQAHILLASFEFKMMYFPRAWMSTGAAVRMAQMLGLHRLDGAGLDVKMCLPPPRDWTEREERRRTFWMAFCEDRYASIGTGWPMTIDERDITTHIPASEEAFDLSRPEQTLPLAETMSPVGATKLSPFGGIVLMACLFGRNLTHLHRPDVDDRDHDLNGEFWKRHRNMDNILLNTSLCLPNSLKLPTGISNPNVVFTNMNIHTSTICLHQAAIFKADRNRLPSTVSAESKVRCITAASEIASIMRMTSHMDLSCMNPFISFCLYVAARVFVQFLKSRPEDGQSADSLRFLLAAMNALKKKNPLTESFLVQLDVDLEALGLRIPKLKTAFPRSTDSPSPGFQMPRQMMQKNNHNSSDKCKGLLDANDCNFMQYDEATGVNGPNIVDQDPTQAQQQQQQQQNQQGATTSSRAAQSNSFGTQQWYSVGHQSSAGPSGTGLSASAEAVLGVTIPPDMYAALVGGDGGGHSSEVSSNTNPDGPTPNSSSASVGRSCPTSSTGIGTTSDETSPQNGLRGLQQAQAAVAAAEMDGGTSAFFPSHAFGTPGGGSFGLGPAGDGTSDFSLPGSWDATGQGVGMTPRTAEAIIQGLNIPMDGIEMNWDAGDGGCG